MDYYCEFAGRIQGLKTANVTIRQDRCIVDEVLGAGGLTFDTATQVERDMAFTKTEEHAVVMLYLRNINQAWHGAMVRYLEDAYATGNDA